MSSVSGTLPTDLYSGGAASKIIVISIYITNSYPGAIQYIINFKADDPSSTTGKPKKFFRIYYKPQSGGTYNWGSWNTL